jgi:hypothetical protein
MLKHLVTRGLAARRRARRDRDNRRPACHLTVEALEGRLLLSGDMVLRWHDVLLAAMRTAGQNGAIPASRTAAIVQTAVYEAVNSIDGTHTPYLVDIPAPPFASEVAAAAEAAHDALVGIFPAQKPVLDLELKVSLQRVKDGDAKTAGIQVGRAAAQIMLAVRAHDGSDRVVNYTPGTNTGDWQPTPPAFLPAALPAWRFVTPFTLQSASQFRPLPPPALTSPEYTAAFNQVKALGSFDSTTRTPDQTEAAIFWNGIVLPATAQWNQIAHTVAVSQNSTLVENARLFALVNLAWADASIGCWDAKYTYNFWRPITAIHAANTDGNPDTDTDTNWTALMDTPAHPAYPSAHSTTDGAVAGVLTSFFGTDAIPFSASFDGFPGVTRSFAGFSAAEEDAGLARIWAGFHWNFDITAGHALGRSVAGYVFQNFLLPRTSPPPGGGAASILFASRTVTAVEDTSVTLGSIQRADARGAGLPVGQPPVYQVPVAATSNFAASDIRAMEPSRTRSEGALPQSRGSSVDDVFGSAAPWEALTVRVRF